MKPEDGKSAKSNEGQKAKVIIYVIAATLIIAVVGIGLYSAYNKNPTKPQSANVPINSSNPFQSLNTTNNNASTSVTNQLVTELGSEPTSNPMLVQYIGLAYGGTAISMGYSSANIINLSYETYQNSAIINYTVANVLNSSAKHITLLAYNLGGSNYLCAYNFNYTETNTSVYQCLGVNTTFRSPFFTPADVYLFLYGLANITTPRGLAIFVARQNMSLVNKSNSTYKGLPCIQYIARTPTYQNTSETLNICMSTNYFRPFQLALIYTAKGPQNSYQNLTLLSLSARYITLNATPINTNAILKQINSSLIYFSGVCRSAFNFTCLYPIYNHTSGMLTIRFSQNTGGTWKSSKIVFVNANRNYNITTSNFTYVPKNSIVSLPGNFTSGKTLQLKLPATSQVSVGSALNGSIWVAYPNATSGSTTYSKIALLNLTAV